MRPPVTVRQAVISPTPSRLRHSLSLIVRFIMKATIGLLTAAGNPKVVCPVDLVINHAVTAAIVQSDGTVLARPFFGRGGHIDRRDKGLAGIRVRGAKPRARMS
jgi:hypothetical protein